MASKANPPKDYAEEARQEHLEKARRVYQHLDRDPHPEQSVQRILRHLKVAQEDIHALDEDTQRNQIQDKLRAAKQIRHRPVKPAEQAGIKKPNGVPAVEAANGASKLPRQAYREIVTPPRGDTLVPTSYGWRRE